MYRPNRPHIFCYKSFVFRTKIGRKAIGRKHFPILSKDTLKDLLKTFIRINSKPTFNPDRTLINRQSGIVVHVDQSRTALPGRAGPVHVGYMVDMLSSRHVSKLSLQIQLAAENKDKRNDEEVLQTTFTIGITQ